jgi:uncharacterized protein (TIGR02145 family)
VGSTTLSVDNFPPVLAVYKVKVKVTGPYLPSVTPSAESNELEIAVGGCPAKISATEWRFFMCHNLGADENADPFTPSYAINGAYYKWGSKEFTGASNDGIIAGPDASGVDPTNGSGNYSWSWFLGYNPNVHYGDNTIGPDVRVKSSFDPCPEGYRVPSYQEWADVVSYNSQGTWVSGSPVAVSGRKFGDFLFLPAAGYRNVEAAGTLYYRGGDGLYWSTRKYDPSDNAYYLSFGSSSVGANTASDRG